MENFQPQDFEKKWYEYWESNDLFSPDNQGGDETYTIVIPPPNVTGSLHIGHALVNTLQDVLIRWKRMCGFKTLWLPGTDHAGIATQMIVDRKLRAKGIDRHDLGREKFVEEVWKHKEESGGMIFKQLRRLGSSLDWSRERFTLDEGLSKAVKKSFVTFYHKGLIYRGNYLVNWCPKCLTAVSDLEVVHADHEGEITTISYPYEDGTGSIEIATTRPETLLGDTAIAVSPEDERYKDMIGKKVIVPLVGRAIPIIADEHCDPEFGTGAVKVTPGHDPNDYEIGKRHNLPEINIFTPDAKINSIYPALEGMDRFEARKEVIKLLKEKGVWKKAERHMHSVGSCQRCSTVIEPRLSTQWFCKMTDMANQSLQAVADGKLKFVPESQGRVFHEWMSNIQDWCISRQLWWGHQIPAWYCDKCDHIMVSEEESIDKCDACGHEKLTRDTDVLDTWFSSGLFPFSTMGWPDNTDDLKKFYPNSTLVTGYDILFFWVARMIMMGIGLTGEVPFPEVFLHGLVRDEKGEKMSKTKGNVVDPLTIVDKFGADALRFTLAQLTVMGRDIKLSEKTIEGNRNFINKFWNATKFTLFHLDRLGEAKSIDAVKPGVFDRWIISKFNQTAKDVNKYLAAYRFNEAAKAIYSFVWHEFCDWYVEIIKPALFEKLGKDAQEAALATLFHVLKSFLRLLHPIMPFVTEELWHNLPERSDTIMLADFPLGDDSKICDTADAEQMIELISTVRNIRGESNIKPNVKIDLLVATKDDELKSNLEEFVEVIQALAGVKEIKQVEEFEKEEGFAGAVGNKFEVFVDLRGAIDVEQETKRLNKEKEKLEAKRQQLERKLGNENFLAKAKPDVVEKSKKELEDILGKIDKINENLKMFAK